MRFLINIISVFFKSEEDRKRLFKVVIPSFIVHFFAAILGIALIFVMTRGLGSTQYGIFTYSFSVVFVIVNLATYGICVLTVRETPSLLSKNKTGLMKGLHKWSVKLVLLICITFMLLTAAFITVSVFHFHIIKQTVYTIPLLLALVTIPLYSIMNYYAASLRGYHKIVLSLLPDNIIKPLFSLISIGILIGLSLRFNVKSAIVCNIIAFGGAALFASIMFYKTTSIKGIEVEYDTAFWKKSLRSFFLLTLIMSINARMDILMLGYLKDSAQVAIYSVADRIGSSLIIFLTIMNQISAAAISRMHSLDQKKELQKMITQTSRGVMIISLPVFGMILIFRKWIMSYFGADFDTGQTALIIISTGQIINIAYGPVGIFALMTGNQKSSIIFTSFNIVINIALNLILTPILGLNGTAIATTCALVTWNTGMFLSIRKKTGISTWIFG
ncbi:MAG TPA: oligosaccharide flippase family protein [Bacteroidia bacterium]|jgi:O-antigen/teichoic acid export membrane protein|nr:oligosaccharide flippase family protein [Bacteroidia bacterium]